MPRHPPCALKHLQHKKPKNEFEISLYKETLELHINTQTDTNPQQGPAPTCVSDARNHYPQIKHHTPPPKMERQPVLSPVSHTRDEEIAGLLSQSPIVCLAVSIAGIDHSIPYRLNVCCAPEPHPLQVRPIFTIRLAHRTPTVCGRVQVSWCSLERR